MNNPDPELRASPSVAPVEQRGSDDDLIGRIGIYRDGPVASWSDHFSPLTRDYAELHLEPFDLPAQLVADANQAQLGHLVMAFVEDRRRDGQIELSAEEQAFECELRQRCEERLDAIVGGRKIGQQWVERLRANYRAAMSQDYRSRRTDAMAPYPSVRSVVCGRGYLGALVPMALAVRSGADPPLLRRLMTAFDCLMLGLQWLDDIVDWREDLQNRDINLMLELLRREGWDAYSLPENEVRIANVGFALLESGVMAQAWEHATRWLHAAEQRQRSLANFRLGSLIRERAVLLDRKFEETRTEILAEIYGLLSVSNGRL